MTDPHHSPCSFRIRKSRIAEQCVCCGSSELDSSPAILMPFVAHRVFNWRPVDIDASWGLTTIQPGHAYSICNSLQCRRCSHVFLDIRFTASELDRLYCDYREADYTRLREHYEPGYTARNDQLTRGIDYLQTVEAWLLGHMEMPAAVLDWGGDSGTNTPFVGKAASVHIYDISNKPIIAGTQRVSIKTARASDYDLITCSQVLEHVPYPHQVLLDIFRTMAGKGFLYLELPFEELMQEDRADHHLRKRHWHEHINFFSERSLSDLTRGCGFRTVASHVLDVTAAGKTGRIFQRLLTPLDSPMDD